MVETNKIVFPAVEKYQAYLKKDGASPELSTEMAILMEGLETSAEDDGAGWSTVGIGHSISHGGESVFAKAGVDWNKFNSSGKLSPAEAKQLFANGDYQRFKAIAVENLGKEWFEKQPRNFQDAVVLEVFNKGAKGFFNVANPTEGYTDEVDQAKIAKLKSGDAKQIFEAFTTGQSVSASRKELVRGNGDTIRERLASRRPFSGALAIAHLTEKPGVVPTEYFAAMANDPLLSTMSKDDILSRTVKYANTHGDLKVGGEQIPGFVPTPETQYAYTGSSKKTKEYVPSTGIQTNGRRKEDFLYDIADLPPDAQTKLIVLFALLSFILGDPEQGNALLASAFGTHVASPESYVEYDKQTGGSLGGAQVASQLGKYNQDYQVKNAPEGWGKATPEAIAQALAGKVVYQEQKGDGKTSYGTLTLTNAEGKVESFPILSGGAGKGSLPGAATGTGQVDARYGVTIPEYEIANFRGNRTDRLANAMGGFSFDLLCDGKDYIDLPNGQRANFRLHADGNEDGKTLGCLGCAPKDSKAIIAAVQSHSAPKLAILPSQDAHNELATHFKNVSSVKAEPAPKPKEVSAALDVAKEAAKGLVMADQTARTRDGFPPSVDKSVVAADKSASPTLTA